MRRTARICLSLTAAVLLAAAGTVVTAPAALAAGGADLVFDHPVFNDPTTDTAQYAIFRQLAAVIDHVPAGETIQMSWFEFKTPDYADTASKPNITTHLISAHQRGVNVRIILDNTTTNDDGTAKTDRNAIMPPYLKLSAELGTNTSASSYIMLCKADTGCIGKAKLGTANAYNHNKFLTASKVQLNDGTPKQYVVFQSSGNIGTWDADTAFNNAITWSEQSSYNNYLTYFADLKRYGPLATGDNNYYRVGNTNDKYKTHYFPRQPTNGDNNQASTDTIVNVLDSVKCSYVGVDDGKTHQTDIRIAMWALTRVAVATKLADLVKAGCWVDVVYSTTSDSALAALKNVGGKPIGITACAVPLGNPNRTVKVHSKYMLIDGAYDDDQVPRVFTGSHNYALTSLRTADETMVRVRDLQTHSDYLHNNFYKVRDFCRGNTTAAAATATVLSDQAAQDFAETTD